MHAKSARDRPSLEGPAVQRDALAHPDQPAASGGAVAPLSVSVLVGAFIFAVGMQLGGG